MDNHIGIAEEEIEEIEEIEADLYITTHVLKLVLKKEGTDPISLKYTIDYPKVELNPLDTKRFKIHY